MQPEKSPASILITGASSGLGEALARRLSGPGVRLWLTGRNTERLAETEAACAANGAEVTCAQLDTRDTAAMNAFIRGADESAPLTLVIANSGISGGTGSGGESDRQAREIFDVNLTGVINTIHPAIDVMRPRRSGHIAVMSSLAAYRGFPGAPAYSASKAAVKVYAEALRGALARDGIAVTAICPGFVKSRMTAVNEFPMPFLMEADRAAEIMVRGLERRKTVIAFPWPMHAMVSLLSLLPPALAVRLLGGLPEKS